MKEFTIISKAERLSDLSPFICADDPSPCNVPIKKKDMNPFFSICHVNTNPVSISHNLSSKLGEGLERAASPPIQQSKIIIYIYGTKQNLRMERAMNLTSVSKLSS
jgi:hypothetical protein